MNVRIENTVDFYDTVKKWWGLHNFPVVHIAFLPTKVFVVSNLFGDLYSIFVYQTDSSLLYLAYPVSNLDIDFNKRVGAFEFLLKKVEEWAYQNKYYLLYTTSPIKPVQETLKNLGYIDGDLNVNQYFKKIY